MALEPSYSRLSLTFFRSTARLTVLIDQSVAVMDLGEISTFFPGHQFWVSTTK